MDITPGRRGRAHISDWEQMCCGERVPVGDAVEVLLLPFLDADQDPALGHVDWLMTLHDDATDESPSTRRVRVRVQRVREAQFQWRAVSADGRDWERVPGSVQLAEVDRLPGSADLSGEHAEEPTPDGWLLDLEILVDLGPQVW